MTNTRAAGPSAMPVVYSQSGELGTAAARRAAQTHFKAIARARRSSMPENAAAARARRKPRPQSAKLGREAASRVANAPGWKREHRDRELERIQKMPDPLRDPQGWLLRASTSDHALEFDRIRSAARVGPAPPADPEADPDTDALIAQYEAELYVQEGANLDAPAGLERTESGTLVAEAQAMIARSTEQIVELVQAEDERQRALPVPPAPPQAVSRAAAHRSFTKRGFVVSEHPNPAYCGLYKRCSTWNGRPAFKNRHERFFYFFLAAGEESQTELRRVQSNECGAGWTFDDRDQSACPAPGKEDWARGGRTEELCLTRTYPPVGDVALAGGQRIRVEGLSEKPTFKGAVRAVMLANTFSSSMYNDILRKLKLSPEQRAQITAMRDRRQAVDAAASSSVLSLVRSAEPGTKAALREAMAGLDEAKRAAGFVPVRAEVGSADLVRTVSEREEKVDAMVDDSTPVSELVRTASDATKEALREAMSGLEEAKRAAELGGFSFSDVVSADHDIDLS